MPFMVDRHQRVHDFSPTCAVPEEWVMRTHGVMAHACNSREKMIQNETYLPAPSSWNSRPRTVRKKFLLFRPLGLWCFAVVVSRLRHGMIFLCILSDCVHWVLLHVKHDFCNTCLKMVDWNLYFIINGSDSYIWLTSQIHSPIVDLCSKSEGIQVNSIFHASHQNGKK